jgi:hypothetical protein
MVRGWVAFSGNVINHCSEVTFDVRLKRWKGAWGPRDELWIPEWEKYHVGGLWLVGDHKEARMPGMQWVRV